MHPISWMQSCSTIEWLASSNEPLGDFGPFEIIRQQSMPATWTNNDRSTGIVSRIRSIDCELGLGNVGNKVNRLLGNEFFPALSKFAFGWYFRSFAGSRSWQSVIISGSPAKPNGMSLKKTLHAMIAARERNRWIINSAEEMEFGDEVSMKSCNDCRRRSHLGPAELLANGHGTCDF